MVTLHVYDSNICLEGEVQIPIRNVHNKTPTNENLEELILDLPGIYASI